MGQVDSGYPSGPGASAGAPAGAGKSGMERRHTVRRRGDAQLDSAAGHDAGRRRMACGESRCADRRRHK